MTAPDPKRVALLVSRQLAMLANDLENRYIDEAEAVSACEFEDVATEHVCQAAVRTIRDMARAHYQQHAMGRALEPSLGLEEV